jgi:hypothetical protein
MDCAKEENKGMHGKGSGVRWFVIQLGSVCCECEFPNSPHGIFKLNSSRINNKRDGGRDLTGLI